MSDIEYLSAEVVWAIQDNQVILSTAAQLVELIRAVVREELATASAEPVEQCAVGNLVDWAKAQVAADRIGMPIGGCPACNRYVKHTRVCPVFTGELHLVVETGVGTLHTPVWVTATGEDGLPHLVDGKRYTHCGICGTVKP